MAEILGINLVLVALIWIGLLLMLLDYFVFKNLFFGLLAYLFLSVGSFLNLIKTPASLVVFHAIILLASMCFAISAYLAYKRLKEIEYKVEGAFK